MMRDLTIHETNAISGATIYLTMQDNVVNVSLTGHSELHLHSSNNGLIMHSTGEYKKCPGSTDYYPTWSDWWYGTNLTVRLPVTSTITDSGADFTVSF